MKIFPIYLLTTTFLITHQIDAAFWKEWEMFRLPGGIQFFDVFNLIAFPAVLYGIKAIALNEKNSFYYSLGVSLLGIITFLIHTGFFLFGFTQFNLPLSYMIIIACGLSGLIQFAFTWKTRGLSKEAIN